MVLRLVTKYSTIRIPVSIGTFYFKISPGKGMKFKVIYGRVVMTTDATVADRSSRFEILDKSNNLICGVYRCADPIQASETRYAQIVPGSNFDDQVSSESDNASGNIFTSSGIIVYEEDQFAFRLVNGVAGDSYNGYLKVQIAPIDEDFHP